ncbi:protein bicaudal C homolog 1-like isoform X4 [Scleropages formosus]|uniref:protein bicaudal C homolog 1-like isoform X4 n=1 Tax=Scleropages formosus TaxID=113540 RepID=UPI0010FAC716|nr:protein bicaudal C homolog 1-like isoform X4 [Scleropages formosus]
MAAQREPSGGPSVHSVHSDPGSNSERSGDSPAPGSENDSCGPSSPLDPEWTEERFRVDRKKLEIMLIAATEGKVNGEGFFQKVMEETNTQVAWPSKLKIGAKSKKDPHIKVSGKRDNVLEAKEKIMSVLDTKSNRVTLKMDVSHTEHSHVIGKGGNNIKKVMEDTDCHIHFPDSNRSNQAEKSNQRGTALLLEHLAGSLANTISVTTHMDIAPQHHLFIMGRSSSNVKHIMQRTGAQIHFPDPSSPQKRSSVYLQGTIDSVCLARQYIMGCLPLVLMFDIKEHVEVEQLCITTLMEQLDVFIRIKPKPKQPSKSVIVKSVERNAFRMYEARRFLLGLESSGVSAPSSSSPSTVLCPIRLEILGSSGLGLTSMVPSASNTSTPSPLLNTINSSASLLQPTGLSGPSQLWSSSLASPTSSPGFPLGLMMHPATHATLTSILLSGVQGYTQSTPSPPPGLAPLDTHVNRIPDCGTTVCALNGHMKHPISVYSRMSTVPLEDKVLISSHNDPEASTHSPSESISSKSSANESSNDTFVEVGMPRSPSHSANSSELKQMLASCKAPASTGKQQAVELLQCTKNSRFHSEWLLSDPESSASKSMLTDKRAPGSEWAAERAAQQNSKRAHLAPQTAFTNMRAFDYEQKKLLATKAMLKKPVVTEVRTPTSTWSGLGFSKSMPAETIKELRRANHVAYKPTMIMTYEDSPLSRSSSREGLGSGSDSTNWRERNGSGIAMHPEFPSSVSSPKRKQNKSAELYLSSSNYMDCISSMAGSNGCTLSMSLKGSDLPELFSKLGLGKYIDVFQQQEIDLQTFLTLTDQDLKELGITTFGARRKMLLAISELNKNRRKMFEPPSIRSSFLEGGSSGRLPRQFHSDMASVSGQW